MRDRETHMLLPRTSRLKPPNGIGAALALGPRSAVRFNGLRTSAVVLA